jgi:hypothetical protein
VEDRVQRLCEGIRSYLASHPLAADTPTGIRQWWLAGLGCGATDGEVKDALERLVAGREMRLTVLADGLVLYSGVSQKGDGECLHP